MTGNNDPLEDVLDDLMLEEPTPSYAALVRWCERYPQHREALEQFFAVWAVQAELPERTPVDEERMAARSLSYALRILRRQGLGSAPAEGVAADEGELLGQFDKLVLTAVSLLRRDGDSQSIAGKIGEIAGQSVMLGAISRSLFRLESRGLVQSRRADATARQYYEVTPAGARALA